MDKEEARKILGEPDHVFDFYAASSKAYQHDFYYFKDLHVVVFYGGNKLISASYLPVGETDYILILGRRTCREEYG